MSDSTQLALAELVKTLGLSNAIEVIEFALPHIIMRRNEIQQCLATLNWDGAARIAHKTISSVRVYSSEQFEQHLQQIYQQNIAVISTTDFQKALLDEFTEIEQSIETWLALQRMYKAKTEVASGRSALTNNRPH